MNGILIYFLVWLQIYFQFGLSSSIYPTRRTEDASFWRSQAENHLKRVLNQLSSEERKINQIAKNVIIFVGDGMGMSTITASRIYKGQRKGVAGEEQELIFETFPNVGLSKTYNVDKQVPDSAGTATALFSGVKTNYGVIGLDSTESIRLPSIMDWGYAAGKRIGLVTTTRITHATPSALYAHVPNRDWECDGSIPKDKRDRYTDIARQLIENAPGNRMNVILGGGKKMMGLNESSANEQIKFGGKFENFCSREDGRNLVDEWMRRNSDADSAFVRNTGQLLAVDPQEIDYLLGLFADNHMSYSSVRNQGPSGEPSLTQMTKKAIQVLTKADSRGFVLMVEGGRIDQAHHQNHARLAFDETVEMDEAISMALNETCRDDTLIIVTADHSHAVTLNGYPVRGNDILGYAHKADVEPYETISYANGPGFLFHRLNQSAERNGRDGTWLRLDNVDETIRKSPMYRHQAMLALDDETHGGEDVPVYAIGPGSTLIRGTMEQNYIGYVMSYAACIGPARKMNPHCSGDYNLNHQHNNGVGTLISFINLLLIESFYFVFNLF